MRCISGRWPRSGSRCSVSWARKASSVISPRSISKSGFWPFASVAACIALPRFSVVIPVWSWKAMNDCTSGVVRTPPKSEMTASTRPSATPHHLIVTEPVAALELPAKEGDVGDQVVAPHPGGADQRAGAPLRAYLVLSVGPELQGGAPLHTVGAVLGGEQGLGDLDGGAVGAAEDGADRLVAVSGGRGRARRGDGKQPAIGEDDPYRPSLNLALVAHRAGSLLNPAGLLRWPRTRPTRPRARPRS